MARKGLRYEEEELDDELEGEEALGDEAFVDEVIEAAMPEIRALIEGIVQERLGNVGPNPKAGGGMGAGGEVPMA